MRIRAEPALLDPGRTLQARRPRPLCQPTEPMSRARARPTGDEIWGRPSGTPQSHREPSTEDASALSSMHFLQVRRQLLTSQSQ